MSTTTHFRICVETILPPSRRTAPGVEGVIDAQHPVSGWLDPKEWWDALQHVQRVRPVTRYGLMYGQQKRETGHQHDWHLHLWRVAEIRRHGDSGTIMEFFAAEHAARDARHAAIVARVDEFLAGFDFAAYGLARALDMATEGSDA